MTDQPEWLTVGAKVAIQTLGGRVGRVRRVRFATVDKIGKRDIVLDTGGRFNINTLEQRGDSAWDPTFRLIHPKDPEVLQDYERDKRDLVARAVEDLMQKWRVSYNDELALRAVHLLVGITGRVD